MKKLWILLVLMLTLAGCGAAETFETVDDVYAPQDIAEPKEVTLTLPVDASAQVMESEYGRLYFCEGYDMMLETTASGDLDRTLQTLTGYSRDSLTVMETAVSDIRRFECVWTSAGEAGDQVGRAVILDDGSYHYCLSVMAPAEEAGSLQESWQELLQSFDLQS